MRLAEQLTFIYKNLEDWHKTKLSEPEANLYHERLLMQGNILTIVENDTLIAYIEVWKINYEQLGRLLCGETIYAFDENIIDGNIAYVNNGWISPKYRDNKIRDRLLKDFCKNFKSCKYVARKRKKYNEAFKVYPMIGV